MTATALAATILAAKDLRMIEAPLGPAPADRLRHRFRTGEICGSGLHCHLHGPSLPFEIKEPWSLGHELMGEVADFRGFRAAFARRSSFILRSGCRFPSAWLRSSRSSPSPCR